MTKTLRLTLRWEWFHLIARGKKTIEYRERKPYWIIRLRYKKFDEVLVRNGIGKHRPTLRRKCLGITENAEKNRFEISLGYL